MEYVIYFKSHRTSREDGHSRWLRIYAGYRSHRFPSPLAAVEHLLDAHGSVYIDPENPSVTFMVREVGTNDEAIYTVRASRNHPNLTVSFA